MMPRTLIALCLLGLAGCASTLSDVGLTLPAAVQRGGYGVPYAAEDLPDGRRAFYWEMRNSMVMRSIAPAATPDGVYSAPVSGSPRSAVKPLPECIYTLYGAWDGALAQWKVTGFKRPHISCVGS